MRYNIFQLSATMAENDGHYYADEREWHVPQLAARFGMDADTVLLLLAHGVEPEPKLNGGIAYCINEHDDHSGRTITLFDGDGLSYADVIKVLVPLTDAVRGAHSAGLERGERRGREAGKSSARRQMLAALGLEDVARQDDIEAGIHVAVRPDALWDEHRA